MHNQDLHFPEITPNYYLSSDTQLLLQNFVLFHEPEVSIQTRQSVSHNFRLNELNKTLNKTFNESRSMNVHSREPIPAEKFNENVFRFIFHEDKKQFVQLIRKKCKTRTTSFFSKNEQLIE